MRRVRLNWLAGFTLTCLLLSACGSELPSDVHVDILELSTKEVTLTELQDAFAGNALTPPLYEQSPGTRLYGIVIPFDIGWLPEGVQYQIVRVNLILLKDVGGSSYPENEEVRVVTPIPLSVERTSDKTVSTKWAASMTGTIEALSGTLSGESTSSESYEKIYRSVTAHVTSHHEISWEFTPFLDEPIPGGLHYVVAVVEVPDGTTGNLFYASAGCYYAAEALVGDGNGNGCVVGTTQQVYIP